MPFCPICHVEYRQGFTHCADCAELLTETLVSNLVSNERNSIDAKPVLLCSTSEDMEANMIMATLQEKGIPAFIKKLGAGQYLSLYMGFSIFGKEIYVPSHQETKAREILAGTVWADANELTTSFDESPDWNDLKNQADVAFYKSLNTRRSIGRILILVIVFGPLIIWLLYLFIIKLL